MTALSWKQEAAQRRDARNAKAPEPDPLKPKPAKKDTRRWCRGKEGVEHKTECRDYDAVKGDLIVGTTVIGGRKGWKILVCTVCGKELKRYYPFGKEKKNPPDWVTNAG